MSERQPDGRVLEHIKRLVEEEQALHSQPQSDPQANARLESLRVELDQCWDLLRQRRALRETGGDPSQAHARSADVVKKYLG